ncbi:MAG: hypothetical protein KAU89_06795 [Candidatus Thorarchaeota archaeon]|jgi:amino acid transporter|nr:hypothetical protein [Candidatus Thorarchaeota archaeon]
MTESKHPGQDSNNPEDMAEEIVDAVFEESEEDVEDGLTRKEKELEKKKEDERTRKARKLKKQLRKRELGVLHYRWPAAILVIAGLLAISTEFLAVMVHPPEVGFDTYFEVVVSTGNLFFLFPVLAGILLIISGVLAYNDPRAPYISIIPAMMMAMAAAMVYFLVTFAVTVDPNLQGQVLATGVPVTMFIIAAVALFSIAMREKE